MHELLPCVLLQGMEAICGSLNSLVQVEKKNKPEGYCYGQIIEEKEFQGLRNVNPSLEK